MKPIDRFIILAIAIGVVMLIAASIDRCDGGCTVAEEVRNGN